jgi:hypothetical protein
LAQFHGGRWSHSVPVEPWACSAGVRWRGEFACDLCGEKRGADLT